MYRYVGRYQALTKEQGTSYDTCVLLNEDTGLLYYIRTSVLKKQLRAGAVITNLKLEGSKLVSAEADMKSYANFSARSKPTAQIIAEKVSSHKDGTYDRKIIYLLVSPARNIIRLACDSEEDFIRICYAEQARSVNFKFVSDKVLISKDTNTYNARHIKLQSSYSTIFPITDTIAPDFDAIHSAVKHIIKYSADKSLSTRFTVALDTDKFSSNDGSDKVCYNITADLSAGDKAVGKLYVSIDYGISLSGTCTYALSWYFNTSGAYKYLNFMHSDCSTDPAARFTILETSVQDGYSIADFVRMNITDSWRRSVTEAYLAHVVNSDAEVEQLNLIYELTHPKHKKVNFAQLSEKDEFMLNLLLVGNADIRVQMEEEVYSTLIRVVTDTAVFTFDKPLCMPNGLRLRRVSYIDLGNAEDSAFANIVKSAMRENHGYATAETLNNAYRKALEEVSA